MLYFDFGLGVELQASNMEVICKLDYALSIL